MSDKSIIFAENINMNSWNNLSLKQRAGLIRVGFHNGLQSLSDIHEAYNNMMKCGGNLHAEGGPLDSNYVKSKGNMKGHYEYNDPSSLSSITDPSGITYLTDANNRIVGRLGDKDYTIYDSKTGKPTVFKKGTYYQSPNDESRGSDIYDLNGRHLYQTTAEILPEVSVVAHKGKPVKGTSNTDIAKVEKRGVYQSLPKYSTRNIQPDNKQFNAHAIDFGKIPSGYTVPVDKVNFAVPEVDVSLDMNGIHGMLPQLDSYTPDLSGVPSDETRSTATRREKSDMIGQQALDAMINPLYGTDDAFQLSNEMQNKGIFSNGGSINIDPSKRGTFKAQATRMGMSVKQAADAILSANEGTYSPAMRKKANFAKNFAHAYGGPLMFPYGGFTLGTPSGLVSDTPQKETPQDANPYEGRQYSGMWDLSTVNTNKESHDYRAVQNAKMSNINFNVDDLYYRGSKEYPDVKESDFLTDYLKTRMLPVSPNTVGQDTNVEGQSFKDSKSIFLNPDFINSNRINPLLSHEWSHQVDENYFPTTPKDAMFLNSAYSHSELNSKGTEELRATNTEARSNFSRNNGNVTGAALDKAIDSASDEEIYRSLINPDGSFINGHIIDVYKKGDTLNHSRIQAVKDALKNVAMTSPSLPGTSTLV